MVEWGRLLSGCWVYSSTEGSNPSLPAFKTSCASLAQAVFDRGDIDRIV